MAREKYIIKAPNRKTRPYTDFRGGFFDEMADCQQEQDPGNRLCADCQQDKHSCPDCYQGNKYKSPQEVKFE